LFNAGGIIVFQANDLDQRRIWNFDPVMAMMMPTQDIKPIQTVFPRLWSQRATKPPTHGRIQLAHGGGDESLNKVIIVAKIHPQMTFDFRQCHNVDVRRLD
jgi:hypothetical protein